MNFSWWTFALQVVNFLILVWLLRRFLFKPVSAIVARRKEEIARTLSDAAAERQKALDTQQELEAQRAGIEAERQRAIAEQREQLVTERTKILEETRAQAQEIISQARKRIAEERSVATEELFSRSIELAGALAERLLRDLALPSIERPFLARVLDYLDRLSTQERESLVSRLSGNPLIVTTAHPLEPEEEGEWRAQIQKRITNGTSIRFRSDPALIAGAEITFPHAILRFNWRDGSIAASKEIHRNEHSG
jgi:F-type H+-transporting ATPase subunit b